jgi:arylsulfatase
MVKKLKELGIYNNTLIIFTSDNGPTFNGGADSPWFQSAGMLGSRINEIKGSLDDGGVRIPFIAQWPGKIRPGTVSKHIGAFWDIFPTFCDVAGLKTPEGLDGVSVLPELLSEKGQQQHEYLYWELGRNQAIRWGNWKAVRPLKGKDRKIRLYDLDTDIKERKDVADENPEVIRKMKELFASARTQPVKYSFN